MEHPALSPEAMLAALRLNGTMDIGPTPNITAEDGMLLNEMGANFDLVDCFSPNMVITNGIWLGGNPIKYALPLFLIQIILITLTSRFSQFIIKPLRQPIVLSEILAGVILGPTVMGKLFKGFPNKLFPPRSIGLLASTGNLGILFYVFMAGIEMDMNVLKYKKMKIFAISTLSTAFPFAIILPVAYFFRNHLIEAENNGGFYTYIVASIANPAFPMLARILWELKLLSSEIGRVSLVSAVGSDLVTWVLVTVTIVLSGEKGDKSIMQSPFVMLATIGFVLACYFLVKPAFEWLVHKTPEGESMSDVDLGIVIMTFVLAGLVMDILGIHTVLGSFILGLVFPNGPHATAFVERLEYFITGLILPIYFFTTTFTTDLTVIWSLDILAIVFLLYILSGAITVGTTTLVCKYFGMELRESLSLGLLLNSQGLVDVTFLHMAREKLIISYEMFAILVLGSMVMTAVTTPIVMSACRTIRKHGNYKRRTIMGSKPDAELRMLVCVHTNSNVPSVVNLLDMSNPSKRSPIFASILHLVELTGRASAMHMVHEAGCKSTNTKDQFQSKQIFTVFETYEQHAGGVSIRELSAISTYASMHDYICTLAAENHTAIIILPFKKATTVNPSMPCANPDVGMVNQNVLEHAPCSVGILVDHGLSNGKANLYTPRRVLLLYFGGPDDREALSYAQRMVEHPSITLTVIRFISGEEAPPPPPQLPSTSEITPSSENNELLRHSSVIDMENSETDPDLALDEDMISEFRTKSLGNESVEYIERVVNSSEEAVAAIKTIDPTHDLYMVGRSQGKSSLTQGLTEWMENQELGPVGDLLAMEFGETLSVLVVQQYSRGVIEKEDERKDENVATGQTGNGGKSLKPCISRENLLKSRDESIVRS